MRKGIVAMVKIVLGVSDVHNSDNENLFARQGDCVSFITVKVT